MVPVGRLTFQFFSAFSTSFKPIWREASLNGSIWMRTAYFWAPKHRDLRDAGDHRDPLRDARLGVLVQRVQRQLLRGEREVQDRLVRRVHLGERRRRRHALRQQTRGLRDGRLNVNGGAVEIAVRDRTRAPPG